jgi:glucosylglycerate phosphorylase
MNDPNARIIRLLASLYGEVTAAKVWPALAARLDAFRAHHPQLTAAEGRLSERDTILITYGDQFREPGRPPLQTLHAFLDDHLRDAVSGVHILPCFPYSSDDGFSVIDYRQIDPELGDWGDVNALGERYRLMFDFVANHVSRHSAWFEAFLLDEAPYDDYFLTADPNADLSQVARPRALPLLTPVETACGTRHVWTTFSTDQIDLNYANPQVLLEMTDVLLYYVGQGAEIIRLDAIAYLWKTIGTPCIHLPQTHAVVKLWRAVLDVVAPGVLLVTETNVPHADNISYFGAPLAETGSTDEAQLVYNFSLAPLALHALQTGAATTLSRWAATLKPPSSSATFFNFIASHDGIGVLPARGIVGEAQVQGLVDRTLAHGGQVSYKANADGSASVYELNITLYDFLNDPANPDPSVDVRRFLASQAILLSLAGVPGIYVHSFFGSRNCHDCFAETGRPRSLNRRKFNSSALEASLTFPEGHEGRVFDGYRRMLRVRREESAFHPAGGQQVLDLGPAIFAVLRSPPGAGRPVLCLVNVSREPQTVCLATDFGDIRTGGVYHELIEGVAHEVEEGTIAVELAGYQVSWLAASRIATMK